MGTKGCVVAVHNSHAHINRRDETAPSFLRLPLVLPRGGDNRVTNNTRNEPRWLSLASGCVAVFDLGQFVVSSFEFLFATFLIIKTGNCKYFLSYSRYGQPSE